MKKLLSIVTIVAIIGLAGWTFRIRLLLAVLPTYYDLTDPIGTHQAVAWAQGPTTETLPPNERPPNIIVILADDLGWNDITLNGGGVAGGTIPTPHIDSIAHQGVNFVNGYASSATCSPSRAALLSGRYPTRFGFEFTPTLPAMIPIVYEVSKETDVKNVVQNRLREGDLHTVPFGEMGLPASEISLAEVLQEGGYHTVHIGKWHLGMENGMAPHEQGFDESLLMSGGLYLPIDHPDVVNSRQEYDPIDQFVWRRLRYGGRYNGGEHVEPKGYLTDHYTEEAIKVIENNKNRPFFLYLAHWAPHIPLQALQSDYEALPHIDNHVERVYASMIRALDRGVGQVLDALQANGLEENTLVIFTSDNGGAHYLGLAGLNAPFRGWKLTFFEGGVHVPYFMKWPQQLPAGLTYTRPVHHFDVYATAAAAAGLPLPTDRKMDGVDLLPYGSGEKIGQPHEVLFWVQAHYQVVLADGWKLQKNGEDTGLQRWLFNLNVDPTEQHNVIDQNPDKLTELEALLTMHLVEQAEPLWDWQLENVIPVDNTILEPIGVEDAYIYYPN